MTFTPGTLWALIVARTEAALASGALQSIATRAQILREGRLTFVVRELESLAKKPRASGSGARRDPFLPYEASLWVADLSQTHVCLLNKFNVVAHHLLIVTRGFEDQRMLLTRGDFDALAVCLQEVDGLGFYNGGRVAGASQAHKHLQLVPLPLAPELQDGTVASVLRLELGKEPVAQPLRDWPFLHAAARVDPLLLDGLELEASYQRLIGLLEKHPSMARARAVDAAEPPVEGMGERQRFPYNLLVTRHVMLLIPRLKESVDGLEVNALGFAGSLFARDPASRDKLLALGALEVLRQVAVPLTS